MRKGQPEHSRIHFRHDNVSPLRHDIVAPNGLHLRVPLALCRVLCIVLLERALREHSFESHVYASNTTVSAAIGVQDRWVRGAWMAQRARVRTDRRRRGDNRKSTTLSCIHAASSVQARCVYCKDRSVTCVVSGE
jgi:hypothetical protein